MTRIFFQSIIVALSLVSCAAAVPLQLLTTAPPGTPLVFSAGSTSTTLQVATVNQNPAGDGPFDSLSAWQTTLLVAPTVGTSGTVKFNSASAASTNYVFGVPQLFFDATISTTSTTDDTLVGFDTQLVVGVAIPAAGVNLLDVDFSASPDASGTFQILALDAASQTEWIDANLFFPGFHTFSNVPPGTGAGVVIGELFVPPVAALVVPEPASLMLAWLGIIGVARVRHRSLS